MKIDIDGYWIRKFTRKDIDPIVCHANNPKVAANLRNRFPHPYTQKDAEWWVNHVMAQDTTRDFAISDHSGAIGGIGLEFLDDVNFKSAGLGYWLGESFWGQGIMTRAVRAFTPYAFKTFDLVRIFAYVFESNPASARVLEKNGFKKEGILRKSVYKNGKNLDQWLYAKVILNAMERFPDEKIL